ncbi:MAG: hypothetical protein JW839_08485, partial [Candidatus Lokiarchaeota archaeon]|nr:hypothetical protein [Candidatus Lokiarchaeota archaeon]
RDPRTGVIWWLYTKIEPLEVVSHIVEEVIKILDETGERRIIFDARGLDSTGSIWGIFERSDLVARLVMGKAMRVAALFSERIPANEAEFMEDVARNRGMELTIQPDEESALRWLGADPKSG